MNTTYTAADIISSHFPAAPKVMSFEDIAQLVQTHELVFQSRAGLVKPRFTCDRNHLLILRDTDGRNLLILTPDETVILFDGQLTVWLAGEHTDTLMVLHPRVAKHTLADDVRAAMMSVGAELGLPNNVASALAMKAYLKVAESAFTVSTPVDN
jgi:hypothetical protein